MVWPYLADSVEVDGHVYFDAADNEPAEGEFVSVLITESLGPRPVSVVRAEGWHNFLMTTDK